MTTPAGQARHLAAGIYGATLPRSSKHRSTKSRVSGTFMHQLGKIGTLSFSRPVPARKGP